MEWPYGTHQLSETDIAALAVGDFQTEIIQTLRATELSKHVLLLEAIRRTIGRRPYRETAGLVENATRLLGEVQARAPEVVAEILGSPHFGLWAARCLFRLRSETRPEAPTASQHEIGHLAIFAAVSALRIGYPFELTVPAQHGQVAFPTLGTALTGRADSSGWAQISLDRQGARVTSVARSVWLPGGDGTRTRHKDPDWRSVVEIEAETDGIRLKVSLDTADPFLRLLSPSAAIRSLPAGNLWQRGLEEAWQILVRHDRKAAAGMASVLTTLVPLTDPQSGDVISATSGWAWGAIAMNLSADAFVVAETLDHEFHHLVLAAVEDLTPLVGEDDHALYYAPWRDDPRPASALLQGIYAHLGVAKFWRQQRQAGSARNQRQSEVRFARSCRAALDAGRTLAGASALTTTGRAFISGILEQLASWQCEPVSRAAGFTEAEIRLEHQMRWQLAHCRPDADTIDALAHAWLSNRNSTFSQQPLPSEVIPYQYHLKSDLSRLLDLRYRDPLRLDWLIRVENSVQPCDLALLTGNYEKAKDEYSHLISEKDDRSGWVGLLLTRYIIAGEVQATTQRPEIAVGVYERIRALTGIPPNAQNLITWLNEVLIPAE